MLARRACGAACQDFLPFQEFSLLLFPLPAEDVSGEPGGLGGVVSTISSSRSPLQPPEADEGEPFTTYFDSKIPIPEDETVSGETPLEKSASEPPESFPRHQFPFQAGLEMEIWREVGGVSGAGREEGEGSPAVWGT